MTGSVNQQLQPPALPVPEIGSRTDGCVMQASQKVIAIRTRASSDWGFCYALGGGEGRGEGEGMINPDGRRHFWTRIYSPPGTETDIGRGDVRAPYRLGAGGKQEDVHTKVVFPADSMAGGGRLFCRLGCRRPQFGGGDGGLPSCLSHACTHHSETAVTGLRLRGRLSGLLR